MQFITNGPDIPDALLRAHEEGRVVFFCGAGISYPAGLPGFKGLVDAIYKKIGTRRSLIEQDAYKRGQFDSTLDLLERRLPGQRIAVRTALANTLKPNLRRAGATSTHAALLQLGRNREGVLRLVTTNFDRLFEHVIKKDKQSANVYAAPMLPIPKNSRWDGLVYLHGLLPRKIDDSSLHRLVISSGDFGLAYLTERWAARFVTELFRNYVVCFVGYSINDPVLRYMMDALAADRMLGETTSQAYALGDCNPGMEDLKTVEWEAKGVIPILYEVPNGSYDHSALHNSLRVWAETYRDGILGKERIVVENALTRPSTSTKQDDFVGRMLWALSDKSGLPAKRFADFNPAPSLEWLTALSESRFTHNELIQFGVPPSSKEDPNLRFSLISRPAPYQKAPWMALLTNGETGSYWDAVMRHLAHWLVRHLNDPSLIIWLAQRGGQLHPELVLQIEAKLDEIGSLERAGRVAELEQIRTNAPNAIPCPPMQTLWRILLTGRVKSGWKRLDLYRWVSRVKRDGLSTMLRLELRELLAPKITLKEPFHWGSTAEPVETPKRIQQLVDCELVLAADHVKATIRDIHSEPWSAILPLLLNDVQQLLHDALDLSRELGNASDDYDGSQSVLPSISPHWQNRGLREWVVLIELLRDAWLITHEKDPDLATRIAQNWFDLPYPAFKRLALFAASKDGCIESDLWVDWLLENDSMCLWSSGTQRETMRLLVLQGCNLSVVAKAKLESAILVGPPRAMYFDDVEPDQWKSIVDYSIWLRLAKLESATGELVEVAMQQYAKLSTENPGWKLASNERDEFSSWMSGTGDPDFFDRREIRVAPRTRRELVEWLKQEAPQRFPFSTDTWRETCSTRFFHTLFALCDLSKEGIWQPIRCRAAIQAWSEKGNEVRSWKFAAPLVQSMPDEVLQELAPAVGWWLRAICTSIDSNEAMFLELCRRVLSLASDFGIDSDQPVHQAINHPVGHITDALLRRWFKRAPNDNDGIPSEFEQFFTQLCDLNIRKYQHGRVLLARDLIALFRVDRSWTEAHLVPLFDWTLNPIDARAVWEGFLWSPRVYPPLLIALKTSLLATAKCYNDRGSHQSQFASFLTYVALSRPDTYTVQDFQSAISALPPEGLNEVARTLYQALDSTNIKREEYWKNHIQPFWHEVWPKSCALASGNIAESLALLSIAAGDEFPAAVVAVIDWLRPIEHPQYIISQLHESGLVAKFPKDALRWLDAIIEDQQWASTELSPCLDAISNASPALINDQRYQRLREYARLRGG